MIGLFQWPLILHPCFFLIIEVKNISGTLYFDPLFDQMVRTKDNGGEEEVFPDPVRQVKRQATQLLTWLKKRKYEAPPIESVVVMANSHTLLRTTPDNQTCLEKVIRDTRLVETIRDLTLRHRKEFFNLAQLRKIASLLIRNDTPLNPDVLTQYGMDPSELMTGVRCPRCGELAMIRGWGKWICPHCANESIDAHIEALRDYGLLIGQTITNSQAKDYLRLPTTRVSHNMLQSLGIPNEGTTRGTRYNLSKLLNKR